MRGHWVLVEAYAFLREGSAIWSGRLPSTLVPILEDIRIEDNEKHKHSYGLYPVKPCYCDVAERARVSS
jgi:hypothetical protein